MILKKIIFPAAIFSMVLFGCDNNQRAEASIVTAASVSINPLPIIMSLVVGEIPEISKGDRDSVLNQVCRVAYGEIKPIVFRDGIRQAGLVQEGNEDAQKINEKANAFTRLVQSNDVKLYQTTCAAYMIASTEVIPDVNQYVTRKKDAKGQPVIEANEEAVINLMPFRLAVARATTELYGKLAADLPEKKAQSMEMYNQKIHRLFSQYAAGYLDTVKRYNQQEMSHRYQLILLEKSKFTFKSSTGYLVDVNPQGMNVFLYGTPWLANGYIMGVVRSIDIIQK
ncbi:hypothetical protein [Serratia fonticola]|uniref:hypothetical protein n=1 Tax=Serratia fonticola TaxID=47917 RepID=UPI00141532C2|nr:hypothetical protein [Serratia fonticola]QIP94572.1 hypothetical protein HAP32_05200 [Serratia fonticola]